MTEPSPDRRRTLRLVSVVQRDAAQGGIPMSDPLNPPTITVYGMVVIS